MARRRSALGERFADHLPSPAHPRDRDFGVVAELLGYASVAPLAAELADGCSDGLSDLPGAGFIGPLQRRREQSIGSDGTDAAVMYRWPHRGLPANSIPQLHRGGTTILRSDTAVGVRDQQAERASSSSSAGRSGQQASAARLTRDRNAISRLPAPASCTQRGVVRSGGGTPPRSAHHAARPGRLRLQRGPLHRSGRCARSPA
jgi:hypothetical protein